VLSGFRSLARHTIVYGAGDIFGRAISVILLPIYVRELTTEENGIISLAFAFIGFSAVFYSLGLNQAVVRYLSAREGEGVLKERLSTAFIALFVIGGIFSAILYSKASAFSNVLLGSPRHSDILRLIAGILFLDALSGTLFAGFRAQQRSTAHSTIRLIQNTMQLGLTVYLILFQDQGARAVFIGNLVSSAFAVAACGILSARHLGFCLRTTELKRLLAFGVPFVPSAFAMLAIALSDRFLIRHFLGLEAAGIYGVAYKLTIPMALVVGSFRSAWAPAILAETRTEDAKALCARVTTYVVLGGVGLFLMMSALAGDFIRLVSGANAETYIAGRPVVPLITFAFVLYGLYIALTAGVYVESRTRILPAIIAAGAGLNIGLNIYLIPRLGFIGAAWSTVAAYGLMTTMLLLSVQRFYRVSYEYRRLLKIAVVSAICTLLIVNNLENESISGMVGRICFAAAFPLLLWGWGFYLPGEWQAVRTLLGKRGSASVQKKPSPDESCDDLIPPRGT
jgi:O-antigen/teichoic acid export membrane protein